MKYVMYNINKFKESIECDNLNNKCKKREKDFSRNRKLTPKDLILFTLNNRGKTTKMELYDFTQEYNIDEVSAPALLKQREKLNEDIFKELNKESLIRFYGEFPQEVKTYKGNILAAIDGSDCEVPNTKTTRERYKSINSKDDERVARIKLSNCYDVINGYVLDTEIAEYKHWEIDLAIKHIKTTSYITEYFPIIYVMDRGYFSLATMYHFINDGTKFIIRLNKNFLKLEQESMQSDDEIVEIKYQYDRIRAYKNKDEEFYNYYKNGNTISLRFVNIKLSTGEIETLMTNIGEHELSIEDINKIYKLRWGIETSYHELKESMQVTNISSSKDTIIKQEIYSQMTVYNIIRSITNDLNSQIEQAKYKHPMKTNFNMAVGFVKRFLLKILIEKDNKKRKELSKVLFENILKNLIPIRDGRKYPRDKNKKLSNKRHVNKRKSI